jgi:hypothetical protein
MSKRTKLEAVIVNGNTIAVRISFHHEDRFFARQYAISEDLDYEKAVQQAYRYRDRIINRSPDLENKSEIRKAAEELEVKVKIRTEQYEIRIAQARKDVARVLMNYSSTEDHHQYLNVYGDPVKRDALL